MVGRRRRTQHGSQPCFRLPFDGHTWPERFVATNVEYDFERHGYEPANMIADAVNWAVVARLGQENLWRVTFAEDAELPEESLEQRIRERYALLLPDPGARIGLAAFSPYRVHERCAPVFRAAAPCWPATRPTSATRAAGWD